MTQDEKRSETKRPGLCIQAITPKHKQDIKKSVYDQKETIEKENVPKIVAKAQKRLFKTKSENKLNFDI